MAGERKREKVVQKVRLVLNALVVTPDNYGRLRFLLLDELKSGKKDVSLDKLKKFIPEGTHGAPFKTQPSRDNVVGEFWVVTPKLRKSRWDNLYEQWRGKEVVVTARPRWYGFVGKDSKTGEEKKLTGIAFDLEDMSLLE